MDLRITNYGTDAREYALVSKVAQPHDYSALLSLISLLINTGLCVVAYIIAIPQLRGRIDSSYHEWCPIPNADDRHFATWTLLPVLVVALYIKTSFATTVVEESLLVIPQIGVQLRKKQRNGHETFMVHIYINYRVWCCIMLRAVSSLRRRASRPWSSTKRYRSRT
ncbi:hypothetical protein, variant 2 [Aphanomyces astaci]|uniref:Uncharacterized protein n=1 Tax=Aphanomyces astaci TaxID=112090 RepID=W4FI39_APHAT|nr:hypothetical protein, variant 1 [Aphanomyces astaci]XP_009844194.1 hypothetical protein, variant 2 [Aphanomyces astaci]ETV66418.1 hypothetical protein, variant 1 [Aphanomyces astaci]ETV66419.1 hypothetical protein, variant 2 [Aphanomyces astaci]|eukprot:XP_009844193.1 hypothetical protein, variant 1 [Aphanomyces astaci]